jgi:DNA-binding MarR family transcriptional regulator
MDIGFTQLAALYALAGPETLTVGDLADRLDRSPSATSRLVAGLVALGYVERSEEVADRRQRVLRLTIEGQALLSTVDRARADQFLGVVRPMPMAERALVAMGVAALASHAMNRRGALRREHDEGQSSR